MDRRVMTREALLAIAHEILGASDRWFSIRIEHISHAITKVTNGRTLSTQSGEDVQISLSSTFGTGLPVSIDLNQVNPETLRQATTLIAHMAPPRRSAAEIEPDDPDDVQYFKYTAKPLLPVTLWHDSTIHAMDMARGETIPQLVEQLHGAGLVGAATVGSLARSVLYLYKQGLTSFAEETDNEVTVTARSADGTASGWSGMANRDWAQIKPDMVAAQAIDLAERSRNPVALEPGRRVAILGPAAVAQLVYAMAPAFDGENTRLGGTPLSNRSGVGGRTTKMGQRVFDPRLVLLSDPTDPMGGFPPFFELYNQIEFYNYGYPTAPITWIDGGILENLAYNAHDAALYRLPAADVPSSVRMTTVPGTKTATIAEMIANCEEGVYVNRFSDVMVLDLHTMMMTGATRDGCFLIKHGKIEKPIKNFRFTDSPFFSFNKVEMIGTPERVAFGAPRSQAERERRWPKLPVIVPPMMIQDFNFSALADAV